MNIRNKKQKLQPDEEEYAGEKAKPTNEQMNGFTCKTFFLFNLMQYNVKNVYLFSFHFAAESVLFRQLHTMKNFFYWWFLSRVAAFLSIFMSLCEFVCVCFVFSRSLVLALILQLSLICSTLYEHFRTTALCSFFFPSTKRHNHTILFTPSIKYNASQKYLNRSLTRNKCSLNERETKKSRKKNNTFNGRWRLRVYTRKRRIWEH